MKKQAKTLYYKNIPCHTHYVRPPKHVPLHCVAEDLEVEQKETVWDIAYHKRHGDRRKYLCVNITRVADIARKRFKGRTYQELEAYLARHQILDRGWIRQRLVETEAYWRGPSLKVSEEGIIQDVVQHRRCKTFPSPPAPLSEEILVYRASEDMYYRKSGKDWYLVEMVDVNEVYLSLSLKELFQRVIEVTGNWPSLSPFKVLPQPVYVYQGKVAKYERRVSPRYVSGTPIIKQVTWNRNFLGLEGVPEVTLEFVSKA